MGLMLSKSVGSSCTTYNLMSYILAIPQRERETHVNILDYDAPKVSGKIYMFREIRFNNSPLAPD